MPLAATVNIAGFVHAGTPEGCIVIPGDGLSAIDAVVVCASTVASAPPAPPVPLPVNVAVAVPLAWIVVCAMLTVPSTALEKAIGTPIRAVRLPTAIGD